MKLTQGDESIAHALGTILVSGRIDMRGEMLRQDPTAFVAEGKLPAEVIPTLVLLSLLNQMLLCFREICEQERKLR